MSSTVFQMTPSFNSLDPSVKIPFPRKGQANQIVHSPKKKKSPKKEAMKYEKVKTKFTRLTIRILKVVMNLLQKHLQRIKRWKMI